MTDKNKIILEYLENKLTEIESNIEKTKDEYPCDNSFCYECGNNTHDASYDEQIQKMFISEEIERYKWQKKWLN